MNRLVLSGRAGSLTLMQQDGMQLGHLWMLGGQVVFMESLRLPSLRLDTVVRGSCANADSSEQILVYLLHAGCATGTWNAKLPIVYAWVSSMCRNDIMDHLHLSWCSTHKLANAKQQPQIPHVVAAKRHWHGPRQDLQLGCDQGTTNQTITIGSYNILW